MNCRSVKIAAAHPIYRRRLLLEWNSKQKKGRKRVQPPNALQSRHIVVCIVRYYRDGKLDLQFVCTFSSEGPVFFQCTWAPAVLFDCEGQSLSLSGLPVLFCAVQRKRKSEERGHGGSAQPQGRPLCNGKTKKKRKREGGNLLCRVFTHLAGINELK